MNNPILKSSHRCPLTTGSSHLAAHHRASRSDENAPLSAMRKTRQRYGTIALVMAILAGAAMMLFGFPALGKGLILGALFSVLNFNIMALAIPGRIGKGRSKSFFYSMASIYLRYALLAIPLVWAFKQDAFAFSSAAAGLFMVQFTILGDHLLARWRQPSEAD